jgi:protein-disulfide isomerase
MNALEGLIVKILIEEEAKARHLRVEELKKQLVPGAASVEEDEIEQVYEENRGALINMNEDEAKERIRLDLEGRQKLSAYKKAITEISARAKVAVLLPEPALPVVGVDDTGPFKGERTAPVTLIEFSDFQCPYCKQASQIISTLLAGYGGKVRFVFKHLPLPIHPESLKAAQAAVCAGEQGRFWDYHDRLFAASDLSAKELTSIASDLGMNSGDFQSCLDSERSRAKVLGDVKTSRRLGIEATPTFLINGRLFKGALNADALKLALDLALQKSGAKGKASEATR